MPHHFTKSQEDSDTQKTPNLFGAEQADGMVAAGPAELIPNNLDAPLFDQIKEVITIVVDRMKSQCGKWSASKNAERMEKLFLQEMPKEQLAAEENRTRPDVVRGLVYEQFRLMLQNNSFSSELNPALSLNPQFVKALKSAGEKMLGKTIKEVEAEYGKLTKNQRDFIYPLLNLSATRKARTEPTLMPRRGMGKLALKRKTFINRLKNEVDFVPVKKVKASVGEITYKDVLAMWPDIVEYDRSTPGNEKIRLVGSELNASMRMARIIMEASGVIHRNEILRRYTELYGDEGMTSLNLVNNHGCSPQGKSGYWKYGKFVATPISIINLNFLRSDIVTWQCIRDGIAAAGLEVPDDTLRAYLTNVAAPAVGDNYLFCLKSKCEKYPDIPWRKFKMTEPIGALREIGCVNQEAKEDTPTEE